MRANTEFKLLNDMYCNIKEIEGNENIKENLLIILDYLLNDLKFRKTSANHKDIINKIVEEINND